MTGREEHAADPRSAKLAEIGAREYELRLLAMMRAQLPPHDRRDPVVVIGPAELLRELVEGALRTGVDALSGEVGGLGDARSSARIVEAAAAVHAWARTVADARAIEAFSFDAFADPVSVR